MELVGPNPRLQSATLERVNFVLATGPCAGYRCDSNQAAFTRRPVGAGLAIHLQCQGCGRSLASLKRDDVYGWQGLPPWNEELRTEWERRIGIAHAAVQQSFQQEQIRKQEEASQRRADYTKWLLTSPLWATLRDRVMRRAMFQCEACLANKAGDVHHITYALGKLPPAWELKAVCRQCHDRLHDWIGGEG